MARIWEVIDDCIPQMRRLVMGITPAGKGSTRFEPQKSRTDEDEMVELERGFRIFATGETPEVIEWGAATRGYNVTLVISIGYGKSEEMNHYAQSDFDSISYALQNADSSDVDGLQFYYIPEQSIEWKIEKDFRYMNINVLARVAATPN